MRKKKNPLLSGPFKVWTIAFTVIPLILIFYYGLTAQEDGRFTLSNILKIATPEYRKALLLSLMLSLISTIICLVMAYPLAMILAGMKLTQHRTHCDDLYHPHVDELPAAHYGLADPFGKIRRHQYDFKCPASAIPKHH